MRYDAKVPSELKETQQWFASIITMPIDEDSRMNPFSPTGNPMEEEAWNFIAPSPTMQPVKRIELYNQQYWWRLLNSLQENFPFLTRLFGYGDFNQTIGVPYLLEHPPSHWSLSYLGDKLPQWLKKNYRADDKPLVCDAALLDLSYMTSFLAAQYPSIELGATPDDQNDVMNQKLHLQPHVELFQLSSDLFQFRMNFLKQDVDYWVNNDFPELKSLPEKGYFILFRTLSLNMAYDQISVGEFKVLKLFSQSRTINEVCEWLENSDVQEEASQNLHIWFQKWTARKLLAI